MVCMWTWPCSQAFVHVKLTALQYAFLPLHKVLVQLLPVQCKRTINGGGFGSGGGGGGGGGGGCNN